MLAGLLATTVTAGPAVAQRQPAGTVTSTYHDPCEHTPTTADGAPLDLRALVLEDYLEPDRRTLDADEPVSIRVDLCAPVATNDADAVRIDLHARVDGPGGPDSDYEEDPTRWITLQPQGGSTWTWWLYEDGSATPLATGPVTASGAPNAVTQLSAEVPPQLVRDAGDPDTTSATGEPPLAVRACTGGQPCGPGYEDVPGSTTPRITDDVGASDVDYLPDPRHLPLTYPSTCQHGTVGTGAAAVTDLAVTPAAAARLRAAGWRAHGQLPDGRVLFRGSAASAVRLVGADAVSALARRRATAVPDDPMYPATSASSGQWNLARVGAPTAWDVTHGSPERLIVVADSGIDGHHPDLAGRALAVRDFVPTRVGAPRDLDPHDDTDLGGHGSFVASLAAAGTDDGTGVAGLGWDSGLLVARVFDAEGCAADSATLGALAWAIDRHADAINLSLGGREASEALRRAGERALLAGVVPVAAAGNRSSDRPEYPAAYDAYVSVTATGYVEPSSGAEDPVASYANEHPTVELAAPGGSGGSADESVVGACYLGPESGRGWCRRSGTSFAAPLVAATIALARDRDPGRTVEGARQLLADTARDLTSCAGCTSGRDAPSGFGRLDAGRALTWLAGRQETLDRIADTTDAVAVGTRISQAAFPGGASSAVLARRDLFADALAGAPLLADAGPLLYTARDQLDPRVAQELRRLLPAGATVHLLGGPVALDPAVARAVGELGFRVDRIAGETRIETAVEIARRVAPSRAPQVLVASAANWPDAAAAGAYAAANRVPLLLTSPYRLDAATRAQLRSFEPGDVVLLGGPVAVTTDVEAQLRDAVPGAVRRVAGATRHSTATALVTDLWGRREPSADDRYLLAEGSRSDGWVPALAASALAASRHAPLLLVAADLSDPQPAELLHDRLGYRLDRAAAGTFLGPLAGPRVTHTLDRLGELLGG